MARTITTDDLVAQVRSMLDEDNVTAISTADDILPALNRGQDYAANILARHYESPMLKAKSIQLVAGQSEYPIPEDALEQRLEKVEINVNNSFTEVERISYRNATHLETSFNAQIPGYYSVVNYNFRMIPRPAGLYTARLWYLQSPMTLVLKQGRITSVDTINNSFRVDTVGSDLTTEVDQLNSYINIVDGQTGLRKGTFQIKNIIDNKIVIKTTPSRSEVQNYIIDTSLTDLSSNAASESTDVTIGPDDYVSVIEGTAVPFFKRPFSNFIIQYAVAELRRKLGDSQADTEQVLQRLEKQVERSWVGRESTLRVKQGHRAWRSGNGRYRFFTTGN